MELVKFDETARAPERKHDILAAELDASVLAPQAVPATTPQVFYDTSFPEVHTNENEKSIRDYAHSYPKIKPRFKWPLVVVAFVIAAAIAVGVGVGIWRHHRDHKQSATTVPDTSSVAPFILNDTSLAAVILPDARHLFFQDVNGRIRSAVRTTQSTQWTTSPKTGFGSDPDFGAKNHTPLAATSSITSNELGLSQITLYYVSEDNVLNSSDYTGGSWSPSFNSSLGNYSTALYTRSLSVAPTDILLPLNSADSTNATLLYYENPSGNVSALLQQGKQWVDITSQDSKSLPHEFRNTNTTSESHTLYESANVGMPRIPFACGANWSTDQAIGAIFYSPNASEFLEGLRFTGNHYRSGSSGPGTFAEFASNASSSTNSSIRDFSAVHQSDIALFGRAAAVWINRTEPVVEFGAGIPAPDSTFPFTRLASVTLADYSFTFLYHQINSTTFAEEQWDEEVRDWGIPQYITVSDT